MHYICQKVSNRILPPSQHPLFLNMSPGVLRRKWPKTHQKIAWYWEPWYFRSKWLNTHKLPSNIKKSILSIVNTYLDRLRKYLWYPTNFLWVCFCSLGVIKYLLGVIRMPKVYFPILGSFSWSSSNAIVQYVHKPQCGKLKLFMLLRFYVKSILPILVMKIAILIVSLGLNFELLVDFSIFKAEIHQN